MPEELFDIVDEQDRVIGRAPRSEVHARGLLHRAVHIFVFNSREELLVQLRSATKDESPLCYTSSASGHVDAGEDYDAAAVREVQEELGLALSLTRLVKLPASAVLANEHTVLYEARSDEDPTPHPTEIETLEYVTIPELLTRMEREWERYSPPFCELLRWYLEERAHS
jgi:isopentenyl-diphosphate delta-isomerase type 1